MTILFYKVGNTFSKVYADVRSHDYESCLYERFNVDTIDDMMAISEDDLRKIYEDKLFKKV